MTEPKLVECAQHGTQEETFVCQHVALSLITRKPVGFFWAGGTDRPRPDAWCLDCNQRLQQAGGEWTGPAAEHLGARLLCAGCYDEARALALETTYP